MGGLPASGVGPGSLAAASSLGFFSGASSGDSMSGGALPLPPLKWPLRSMKLPWLATGTCQPLLLLLCTGCGAMSSAPAQQPGDIAVTLTHVAMGSISKRMQGSDQTLAAEAAGMHTAARAPRTRQERRRWRKGGTVSRLLVSLRVLFGLARRPGEAGERVEVELVRVLLAVPRQVVVRMLPPSVKEGCRAEGRARGAVGLREDAVLIRQPPDLAHRQSGTGDTVMHAARCCSAHARMGCQSVAAGRGGLVSKGAASWRVVRWHAHELAGEAGAAIAASAERVGVAAAQVPVAQQGRVQQRLNRRDELAGLALFLEQACRQLTLA